jgi:hypothetical protein
MGIYLPITGTSVPICPQQHIPVLGRFLQAALLNFSPRLIEFIG